jgi:hypothetical protein
VVSWAGPTVLRYRGLIVIYGHKMSFRILTSNESCAVQYDGETAWRQGSTTAHANQISGPTVIIFWNVFFLPEIKYDWFY